MTIPALTLSSFDGKLKDIKQYVTTEVLGLINKSETMKALISSYQEDQNTDTVVLDTANPGAASYAVPTTANGGPVLGVATFGVNRISTPEGFIQVVSHELGHMGVEGLNSILGLARASAIASGDRAAYEAACYLTEGYADLATAKVIDEIMANSATGAGGPLAYNRTYEDYQKLMALVTETSPTPSEMNATLAYALGEGFKTKRVCRSGPASNPALRVFDIPITREYFRRKSMREVSSRSTAHRLFMCLFAMAALLLMANGAEAQASRSKMNCSPVTPDMKVPFIEVDQLPNVARDPAYFEWCTDLDNAWTPQSYPDAKYVPKRTPANEARVRLMLQGLKDYVAAESDDWVSYVNAWLGSTLPPPRTERLKRPDGSASLYLNSDATDHMLKRFETGSKILSIAKIQPISPQGVVISNQKKLDIFGLGSENLCITSIDLQKAFENQPGYLLRPMSVRTSEARPNPEELAKLGGQWYGYEVHVFSDVVTGHNAGLMLIGFGFKPCAARISVNVTNENPQGDKK